MKQIKRVHTQSKGVYGSPRIHAELVDKGIRVGRHKVARLMRLERLRGCPKRQRLNCLVLMPNSSHTALSVIPSSVALRTASFLNSAL